MCLCLCVCMPVCLCACAHVFLCACVCVRVSDLFAPEVSPMLLPRSCLSSFPALVVVQLCVPPLLCCLVLQPIAAKRESLACIGDAYVAALETPM